MRYELNQLGWHSFQQLCLTISREVFGQAVQSFLNSKDGGRDGAFAGTWIPRQGQVLKGKFVIQCKFTSRTNAGLKPSDISEEFDKAKRLVERGLCDCYILLTNFDLSGRTAATLDGEFSAAGVKHFLCYGSDWICQQIQEHKRLRMLVPRLYGLGDLSQILDERAYAQARALLESMREDLSKIVLTQAYTKAVRALEEHGFVLLLGEPACGKTTIAAMLAMAAIDQWNVSTMKLETAAETGQRWNPNEPRQFFWIDDAFGVMQYEAPLAFEWNRLFPKIRAMINAGARVVLTSRDYIYRRARLDLKESAFPLIRESQVVIDVREITKDERKQILYNHIKLGTQTRDFRLEAKPYLEAIASNPRFSPETARRLGSPLFTKNLAISHTELTHFVESQEQLLQDVIQGLDVHSQAALALVFIRSGALDSPIRLRGPEEDALSRLGSNLGATIRALDALRDSLVANLRDEGRPVWKFKHPTVGDAYASILLRSPELMDIYVGGAPVEKLMETITCGDVGLKGAVVASAPLYSTVLEKVSAFSAASLRQSWLKAFHRKSQVDRFLTYRCDEAFLRGYIEAYPETLERVSNPGRLLSVVSEVDLALRLFQFGLLPENRRQQFVKTVTQYAVEGSDGFVFESKEIRKMFSPEEDNQLLARVREELIPRLSEVRDEWEENLPGDEDPESYIQPFMDVLSAVKREFAGDSDVIEAADREMKRAVQWADEAMRENPEHEREGDYQDLEYDSGGRPALGEYTTGRSIFDDVEL